MNSLSKNGKFSPIHPQNMANFARFFPIKTLCTLLLLLLLLLRGFFFGRGGAKFGQTKLK
jgi:hypothetical protein